jgi:flagellar hook-associated protein 1 FlgK
VDVKVDQSGGTFKLSISGYLAVQDDQSLRTLVVTPANPAGPQPNSEIWTSNVTGGQIKGITDSLATVASYSNYLDSFAQQLATGPMDIKLTGTWQFPQDGVSNANVSGTLPDGTPFASAQALTPGQHGVTIDNSVNPPLITVPAGTTVHVNGLNGLLRLGYSPSGQVTKDFFTDGTNNSPPNITASNITVGVNADEIGFALRPTPQVDAMGNKTWTSTSPGLDGDGTLANTVNSMKSVNLTFPDPSTTPTASNPNPTLQGTLDEFQQAVVGRLGIDTQEAQRQVKNQTVLLQQVDTKRQSVSGVSLDEEMANMIKYQQAYSASARMITTIDEMLSTLIDKTGVVGR